LGRRGIRSKGKGAGMNKLCTRDTRKDFINMSLCGKGTGNEPTLSIEQWLNSFLEGKEQNSCKDCSRVILLALQEQTGTGAHARF